MATAFSIVAMLFLLLAAAGALWIRALYGRIAALPALAAELKVTAARRDELARQVAFERQLAIDRGASIGALRAAMDDLNTTLRRETDAEIDRVADDIGAQLELANQLLERAWPGDRDAAGGAAGDREGGGAAPVRAPTAPETPSSRGSAAS